ncbi:hypothetical protein D3C75_1250680 [compost metagenome]
MVADDNYPLAVPDLRCHADIEAAPCMADNILKQIIQNAAEPALIHCPIQRFSFQINFNLKAFLLP